MLGGRIGSLADHGPQQLWETGAVVFANYNRELWTDDYAYRSVEGNYIRPSRNVEIRAPHNFFISSCIFYISTYIFLTGSNQTTVSTTGYYTDNILCKNQHLEI